MLPEQFMLLRPYWLLAFIPLALLVWRVVKSSLISRSWESVVDRELLPYILVGNQTAKDSLPAVLLGVCGALAIFALAGPVWEKLPQPVFSTQTALVIALDLSRSMNAADIKPSRLERARFKITDILAKRAEGQSALLVYAGDAFAVTPLTDDVATIESQLSALTTEIMPVQGNNTDVGVNLALDLLKKGGATRGDILLITDEVDFDVTSPAVQAVRDAGYRLSVMGVGTAEGAPIPKVDGGFMTDPSGNIVVPVLDDKPMQRLADLGGGRYLPISQDDTDVDSLDNFFVSEISEKDMAETKFETDVWREQGPWLLIVLLPLAALVFRRGYLIVLVLFCLPYSEPSQAFDWDNLWTREDQRAMQALEKGDATTAAELFSDPAWKGVAQYRAGNYDESIKTLQGLEQTENNYNLANALARKGMYKEAISLYDKVLEANPKHEDAKYNKELLEKEMEQPEQKQDPNKQQDQQKDEDQDKDEKNKQQNKQQDKKDQQEQDQNQQQQDQQQQDQQKEDEKKKQEEQQQQQQQQEQKSEPKQEEDSDKKVPKSEEKQATEQWLRRIPDDPGGLLRRKFLYQYQQRDHDREAGDKSW